MFDQTTFIAYLSASVVIILAPGPAQALVLARTISDGKKAGIITAIGLNVGTIVHTVAAALGVSAILATSATAFVVMKYLGAAYLVYLGIKEFFIKENKSELVDRSQGNPSQTFTKAIVTGVLNPKVALFFLAFLPQFVNLTRGSLFLQFLVLGSILAMLDIVYESVLAAIAGTMSGWLTQNQRFILLRHKVTGTVLITLGLWLVFVQQR